MHRRDFLKVVGFASLTTTYGGISQMLSGCQTHQAVKNPLFPTQKDDVILAPPLSYQRLISWGDALNSHEFYGDTNDFVSILPIPHKTDEYFVWVNHEYVLPYLTHGITKASKKEKKHILMEQKSVGGSLIHAQYKNEHWKILKNSPHNKRWDGQTQIPFAWSEPIANKTSAIGTFANCSGGQTPWGTFLTCEENYEDFYGEVHFDNEPHLKNSNNRIHNKKSTYGWAQFFDHPPEHYGWVVEINPVTKKSHKLVALGRFAHEGAKVHTSKDGRCVVYMGDDKNDECIYKFIANRPGSLTDGQLYVANTRDGVWENLSLNNPKLKNLFLSQTDLLIQTRKAAKLAGGTPQDRPEDIEILNDGTVLIALTNNIPQGRPHGQILALQEKNNDPLSLEFSSHTWLECGPEAGLSCPDNFTVDSKGNLWVTSDMSGKMIGSSGPYAERGNNGLFLIPTQGNDKGVVYQVASAPNDAEFTGPCLSPDEKSLLLSVQHPGEQSKDGHYTSHWPQGKNEKPLSSLIAIYGIERLLKSP